MLLQQNQKYNTKSLKTYWTLSPGRLFLIIRSVLCLVRSADIGLADFGILFEYLDTMSLSIFLLLSLAGVCFLLLNSAAYVVSLQNLALSLSSYFLSFWIVLPIKLINILYSTSMRIFKTSNPEIRKFRCLRWKDGVVEHSQI